MNLPQINLPEKARRWLKRSGYSMLGLTLFNLSFYQALPMARIREQVETVASERLGATVKLDGFGLATLTGPGVRADSVLVTTAPHDKGEKPARYRFDSVSVRFGLLSLLRGLHGASFKLKTAGGTAKGSFEAGADALSLSLDIDDMVLAELPGLADALHGVPLTGVLGPLVVDVAAPGGQLAQAEGQIELALDNVVVGDGKAKLTVASNPLLASGLTLPRVAIGRLAGKVSVSKGRATLHDFRSHSPDLDVELEGYVELRDPASRSVLHLYLKLKPSEALLKREPTLAAMVNMAGAPAKRSDGFYGISFTGPAFAAAVQPARTPPSGLGSKDAPPPAARPVHAAPPTPPRALPEPPRPIRPPPSDVPAPAPEPEPTSEPEPAPEPTPDPPEPEPGSVDAPAANAVPPVSPRFQLSRGITARPALPPPPSMAPENGADNAEPSPPDDPGHGAGETAAEGLPNE